MNLKARLASISPSFNDEKLQAVKIYVFDPWAFGGVPYTNITETDSVA